MNTSYEVWYLTDDGIMTQEVDGDGIAKEHEALDLAKKAAKQLKASGVDDRKVSRAWVLEKKAVFEC